MRSRASATSLCGSVSLYSSSQAARSALLLLFMLFSKSSVAIAGFGVAAAVFFVGGLLLLCLGVLGEYLGRVYDEVRSRPAFDHQRLRTFRPGRSHTTILRRRPATGNSVLDRSSFLVVIPCLDHYEGKQDRLQGNSCATDS
jgi:hypothetical protein